MRLKKLITGLCLILFSAQIVLADSSASYKVDVSSMNQGGNVSQSASYKLNETTVGFVNGEFGISTGYTLGSGLVYLELLCGNGIPELGEACDDGDVTAGDGCSAICVVEPGYACVGAPSVCTPVCGNGIVTAPEQCDDGNLVSGDGCSATCTAEVLIVCGNGVVQGTEQCDDGNLVSGDGCSSSCTTEGGGGGGSGGSTTGGYNFCGNGIKNTGEQCDDGNLMNGDGCDALCRTELPNLLSACGNKTLDSGEQCDDGNLVNGDGCSSVCQKEMALIFPVCGNAILEIGETCDDGNKISGDGCNKFCRSEVKPSASVCGNQVVESGEACDDGNLISGDGCDTLCQTEQLEEGKIVREIRLIAHPEKRVNATQNWGTRADLIFFNKNLKKTSLTLSVDLNDSGWSVFETDKLEAGSYDISIKGRSHLTKVLRGVLIDQTTETIDFSNAGADYLVAGDVYSSKDDFVNGLDISATVNALYTGNLDADLNHDGLVNALDLSIVVGNIYQYGEKIKI